MSVAIGLVSEKMIGRDYLQSTVNSQKKEEEEKKKKKKKKKKKNKSQKTLSWLFTVNCK